MSINIEQQADQMVNNYDELVKGNSEKAIFIVFTETDADSDRISLSTGGTPSAIINMQCSALVSFFNKAMQDGFIRDPHSMVLSILTQLGGALTLAVEDHQASVSESNTIN